MPAPRKALAVGAGLIASALFLTGCSAADESAPIARADVSSCDPDGVTITAQYASQGQAAAELGKAAMEEKYQGLTVDLKAAPEGTSYDELTQQVVADIAAGSRPDVIMLGLDQLQFWVEKYSPQAIDTDSLRDTYDRDYLDVGTVDGTTYVAPFQISVPVLYTNTTLTESAGIDELPTTHSEVLKDARAVQDKTDVSAPIQIPRDNIAWWFVQAFVGSGGGTFVNDDGTAGFDSNEGRAALEIYQTIGDEKLEDPVGWQDAISLFTQGNVAYFFGTPAVGASVSASIGDSFDWTISDMPIPDGGTAKLPAGGNGWMVLSDDACRAAFSNELIGAMLDPEVIVKSSLANSYIPVDSAAKAELLQRPEADGPLGYAWRYEGTPVAGSGWDGENLGRTNQYLQDMVQSMVDQGQDVSDVVPDTAARISALAK
ncbi:extracellular solute-binding protein [Pseudarthrobacter sp. J64]|uniref:ABC transporter substrate-binding protein n=1 Tax=unclassified Pseudarthrobacter TaxID=2647000 RepID=UPI002E81646A|nr:MULTISPECIES: extracellular solute-binding protein [unclassified Pseudarthrobacter]MEE2524511.1 extracellular solute-binding protein [Pseudarthrobacter sp. J47]MEE2570773.1 extracellular solute-binding protein [Pseudarthrobacter sp. J64]